MENFKEYHQQLSSLTRENLENLAYEQALKIQSLEKQIGCYAKKSFIDELTGLRNYRYFATEEFPKLEKHIKSLRHTPNTRHQNDQAIFLGFADIDGLKSINDTMGHSFGNQVIKSVAEALINGVRPEDTVGRYTQGDEFYIIIRLGADIAIEPAELAGALNKRCSQIASEKSGGQANFSMAFVRVGDYRSVECAIDEADALMYDIKNQKKALAS